jgi:hypothetical protein
VNAIHCVDGCEQVLFADRAVVDHRPEFGLLCVELREFVPMMAVDALVGVARSALKYAFCAACGETSTTPAMALNE